MTHWIAMEMQQTHRKEYTNEIMLSLWDLGKNENIRQLDDSLSTRKSESDTLLKIHCA